MAPYIGTTGSEAAKMKRIITEFFAKSLHIILESREFYVSSRNYSGDQAVSSPSPTSASSSSVRTRDKWFNLALRECPAALEYIVQWRQSNLEPIVVDVILVQRPQACNPLNFSPEKDLPRTSSLRERNPFCWNSEQEELGHNAESEKIVERWVIQYESRKTRNSNSGSRRSSNTTLQTLYKKSTLLLRSLYATVRLLPAYKIFRDLNSSGQICAFTLAHRVSSFVEPFTHKEEAEMQKFGLTPVDTSCGRLCLSVLYRSSSLDVRSEILTPLSPRFIPDYVGSPLADPLRSFPSLPVTGLTSHGSFLPLPLSRRHSWSSDLYRASPSSITCSPSPTYSESCTSVYNAISSQFPPASLPPHPPERSLAQRKNPSFDEYYRSPNLSPSPSPSPSPPIYSPGTLPSERLLRSESSPVGIPTADSPGYSKRHNFPPSPPLRGARRTSRTDRSTNVMQTVGTAEKLFSLGKDESKKYSGGQTSHESSPRISFSRSSSRSYQDDFDDNDFTCPFDEDDDDLSVPSSRESQDAAVGALVNMLNKAPPLHHDISPGDLSQESRSNNAQETFLVTPMPASSISSGLVTARKTTTDALEEFQGYKDMKNLLLMRSSKSHV